MAPGNSLPLGAMYKVHFITLIILTCNWVVKHEYVFQQVQKSKRYYVVL